MATKKWEGSKADKAKDKKMGWKEGSKADKKADAIAQAKLDKKVTKYHATKGKSAMNIATGGRMY